MRAAELRERVLAAVRGEDSPTRAVVRIQLIWRLAVAMVVSLAVFVASKGIRVGDRPSVLLIGTALGAGVIAVIVGAVAFGRGGSMLGRSGALLWSVVVATPLVLLTWKLTWTAHYGVLGPMRIGLKCLALSLATAAVPLAVLISARRDSDPIHPAATGAAVGAAVGAMAWLLVDLWCPVGHFRHLLVGHVLPIALLVAGGALLGRRYVAIR